MMNILERIIQHKHIEVGQAKKAVSIQQLKEMPAFSRQGNSLVRELMRPDTTGIIAEYKRASPSRGIINSTATTATVVEAYRNSGAAAVSVLTDQEFFNGSLEDLRTARKVAPDLPILRKDFIIDEYQIIEAKAHGADIILLIAANLSPAQVLELAECAKSYQLEVLLEIHNDSELNHICDAVDIVGVNNRDLKTFVVDLHTSVQLSPRIPVQKIKISESGIQTAEHIALLKNSGFSGFLIGENFMKAEDPAIAFARFVESLSSTSSS